jgi:hypothetical protein
MRGLQVAPERIHLECEACSTLPTHRTHFAAFGMDSGLRRNDGMLWIAHSHQATCVVTRELRHTSFIRIVDGSLPVELPWPSNLQSHRTSSRCARISRRSALYDGALHLGRASGNEPFETMAEGAPKIETVE